MQRFVMRSDHGYDRLIWVGQSAMPEFWDAHWQEQDISSLVAGAAADATRLAVFPRHLRPGSIVLEAGCGLGQWVEILSQCEFNCFGVDYAVPSLTAASIHYGGQSRFAGADIRTLPFAEATFDAVISLGVVEHCWPGPSGLIREMLRTVRAGGLLFLSVPYFNAVRRLKTVLPGGLERKEILHEPLGFYQFAFGLEELAVLLAECGVVIVETVPLGGVKGLNDELPALGRLRHWLKSGLSMPTASHRGRQVSPGVNLQWHGALTTVIRNRIKDVLSAIACSRSIRRWGGHMILVVGRKQ